jgi:transcriptional regulator with XRE-family HTH domain
MLSNGSEVADIAAEMAHRWRFNLRQAWRYAHGLSQEQAAARCNAVLGSDRAPLTGKRISDYEAWPQRGARPTLRVLTVLARVYGAAPRDLLADDELPLVPESERLLLDSLARQDTPPGGGSRRAPATPAGSPADAPHERAPSADDQAGVLTAAAIRAAARVSAEHARRAEATEVGAVTLEQLDNEIATLARTYILTDPGDIFGDLVRVRDRVFGLLRRRAYPAQLSHLYLLAGQACGLLASASMELGCHGAAFDQTYAAWAYAEVIGHDELRAWLRGTQALIAFWSGRPRDSVRLAQSGRDYVRGGTGFVRLCNIESRGWAHLGNRSETQRVIAMGHRARDLPGQPGELHDRIGGEFGFDEARQAFCNAGAYVQLGQARLAVRASERALRLYDSEAERHRRYGGELSTRLQRVHADLLNRDLDAAEAGLEPLIAVPNLGTVAHLPAGLAEIRTLLGQRPYGNSREARELAERIRAFPTQGGPKDH